MYFIEIFVGEFVVILFLHSFMVLSPKINSKIILRSPKSIKYEIPKIASPSKWKNQIYA